MDTLNKQTEAALAVCVSNLAHKVNVDHKNTCKINTTRQNTQVTNPARPGYHLEHTHTNSLSLSHTHAYTHTKLKT